MNLAVLGAQPPTSDLIRAALVAGHRIVWLDQAATGDPAISDLAPDARRGESWEVLLDLSDAAPQGVIVSRGDDDELRAEQLRKLVQAGANLLVVQPVVFSMLVYYELDMIRGDVHGVLRHYVPGLAHPFLLRAAELVRGKDAAIGECEQVVMERLAGHHSSDSVHEQLIRDASFLQRVCGASTRVIALGSNMVDNASSVNGLQTTSVLGTTARWSLTPTDAEPGARLTLFGSSGKAVLTIADSGTWCWELSQNGQIVDSAENPGDTATVAIEQFIQAVEHGDDGSEWQEATQVMSLVDAAARSLKRGRAIELHEEEVSEQSTFKGMMAAAGCGLIMLVLLVPLVAGFIGDTVGINKSLIREWPLILLVLLGIFLGLQLLPLLVFRKPSDEEPER